MCLSTPGLCVRLSTPGLSVYLSIPALLHPPPPPLDRPTYIAFRIWAVTHFLLENKTMRDYV